MPLNEDIDVRSLARSAKLSVNEMSGFLSIAKKKGFVENRSVRNKSSRMALWKRIKKSKYIKTGANK